MAEGDGAKVLSDTSEVLQAEVFQSELAEFFQAGISDDEVHFQEELFQDVSSNPVGGKEDQSGLSHDSLQR